MFANILLNRDAISWRIIINQGLTSASQQTKRQRMPEKLSILSRGDAINKSVNTLDFNYDKHRKCAIVSYS